MKPSLRVARAVSILGHPMLVMPFAAWLAIRGSETTTRTGTAVFAIILVLGSIVLGYSAIQVRRGHWQHVDASGKAERRSLNLFLLTLFATTAFVAWLSQGMSPLFLALIVSAAIILAALLISPYCKLSLHVSFIVFAAFVSGSIAAAIGIGMLAASVAWSRLKLDRHTPLDLVAGLLAGVAAGIVFRTS